MKKLNLLIAVAIALSAATMLYLAKATAAAQSGPNPCAEGTTTDQPCVVTITPNSESAKPPTITPRKAYISKDKNQEVEWKCDDSAPNCQFTVVFTNETEKPFKDRVFNNSHAKSGPPTAPKNINKPYKYSVIVNEEGSADPIIIVK